MCYYAKIVQTSAMKTCFQIDECSQSYEKISIQRTNINGNFFQKTCKSYQKPCNFSHLPKYNMKYNKIRAVFFVFVIVLLSGC